MFAVGLIALNIVTTYKTSQGHSSNPRSWCAQPGQLENLLKAFSLFYYAGGFWMMRTVGIKFHKQEPVSKYKTFPSLWNHILTCSRYLDSRNFTEATHYRSFMAFISFPLVHMDTIDVCPRRILLLIEWLSVQFSCSVVSDSLWLHGLLYARLPCPSPTAGVYSNSCS